MGKVESQVRSRLRAASHLCHVRINSHPLLVGITRSDYSLSSYHGVLLAYFQLYAALEKQINRFTQSHAVALDYSRRLKLPWLEDDLHFFNADTSLELNPPRYPIEFPEIKTMGELIGVLYAIEGASLGGQMLSQHLHKNLGLSTHQGASFLTAMAKIRQRNGRNSASLLMLYTATKQNAKAPRRQL